MLFHTITDLQLKYKGSQINVKKKHLKILFNLLKAANNGVYDYEQYSFLVNHKRKPQNLEEELIVATLVYIDQFSVDKSLREDILGLHQLLMNRAITKEEMLLINDISSLLSEIQDTKRLARVMVLLWKLFKEVGFPLDYFGAFTSLNFFLMKKGINNIFISEADANYLKALYVDDEIKSKAYCDLIYFIFNTDLLLPNSYVENLKPITIDSILKICKESKNYLQKECRIVRFYIYGSYAKNLQRFESDLDVAVIFKEDMSYQQKEEVRSRMRDYLFTKLARFIDISEIFNENSENLEMQIGKYIKVF